jgi:PAS domain S-box-containing protein
VSSVPLCIVVVDDSPEDRAALRHMLLDTEQRYRFIEAGTGAAGVAACMGPEGQPDCVILDYYLPDMAAEEVLAALKAGGPVTVCPVLVLTGIAEAECGPLVLRAGAQDYLDKSWLNPHLLVRAIDNAIERHQLIGEAQRREATLRERDEQLQLALEASGTGLWTRDLDQDALHVSPEFCRIHGIAEGDAPQRVEDYLEQLVHEDDRDGVRERARAAIADQTPYEDEYRILRSGGEIAWVASRGKAVYDAEARPWRLFGATTDITRRKRAEIALLEADQRKDEFLAELAHEVRNPLAVLRLGLGLITRADPEHEPAKITAMMERQIGHLVRLVDDLLDVSRIGSGRIELTRARVELRRVVDAALELSRPLVEAAEHTLVLTLPEGSTAIDGDLARLAQVVSNVVNNAAKYTPPRGRIEISALASEGEVRLRVTDSGVGIPREMLSRVFDIFTQVPQTKSRAQGGLGIGLSVVRKLVEMHGGQVSAESAGPGQGSTFTICLPLAPPLLAGASRPPASLGRASQSAPARRVLVVDDNDDAADILAETLRRSGHDAVAVYDGPAALDSAQGRPPDVVLLDLGLPGMDGYEIARRMRAEPHLSDIVLIALTGWGSEADRRRSREAGFAHHLTKPVDPTSLNELLTRLVPAAPGPS